MATRMQQRRGTATQWTSSNDGDGPILNAGEIGWESDTNKFKIGDGVSYWADLTYFVDATDVIASSLGAYLQDSDVGAVSGVAGLNANQNLIVPGASIIIEGTTDNEFETTLTVTDPTADRTITFPDAGGTVITTGNLSDITNIGVFTSTITMEGSSADDNELTLSAGNPTADRTLTFPDATDTLVGRATTDTFTNKSVSLTNNTLTGTKAEFNTAMTDADFATIDGTETLTNKTLTTPVISSITNTGTLTLPTTTGTVALTSDITVSASSTNTFSNKSISLASNTVTGTTAEFNSALSDSNFVTTGDTGSVTSTMISDGTIVNGDISASAAIDRTKISGTAITAADSGTVTSTMIADGTIVDGDINAAAAIAQSKIANLTTDLGLKAPLADPTFTGTISAASLTLSGDLTVNGTTTNLNSTNLVIEDKNIILGDTASPADNTADGGGITLKGTTDKTFNWVDSTDAWTSSEHINLVSTKELKINGTSVLSGSTLGSGVTGSSLTSVGTITSGTWTGTAIAIANGGTGQTTAMTAATALLPSQTSNSGKYLTNDGEGTLSWGTVTGYSAPTLGSTSIASGATVTTIVGLTKIRSDQFTTLDASGFEVDLEIMQIMAAL